MAAAITVNLTGRAEVQRMFEEFHGAKLNNRIRRALRRGAKEFRTELRAQASTRSDLPRTFRKTRTRAHRNPLGVSVSPQSPLSNIFEGGARPHIISPKAGGILTNANRDAKQAGGEALFFAAGSVLHPGMKARPLLAPVFDAAKGDAEEAFAGELFEGLG